MIGLSPPLLALTRGQRERGREIFKGNIYYFL